MRIIAKLLLLSLEEDEEVVLNAVMSALESFENKTQLKEKIACEKLAFAGMEIDASKRLVYRGEKEVNITFTEFEILHLLARNPGRVFSKEQIYDIVWKESYSGDYNIVMSHIRNIREKIEDNPKNRLIIDILILFFTLPTNLAVQFTILSRGYTGVSLKNRNKITLR